MTVKKYGNGKWGYYFGHDGKRYRKQGFKTKREATEAEVKAYSDLAQGLVIDNKVSFGEYFKDWCETFQKPKVSEKTYESYMTAVKHIKQSDLYDIPLNKLTRQQYQKFINEFSSTHSKETIRKINGKIKSSLDDAVFEGLIKKNITYKVEYKGKIPQKTEDAKFINLNEYSSLKRYLMTKENKSALALFIMIATGCRVSGAINMRTKYINQLNDTIYIDEHKTDTSPRTVEVSKEDMNHIIKTLEKYPISIDGYIFKDHGTFLSINAINKALKKYCDNLGIKKITSHALRHTHCSYLLAKDISVYYISKRLGHKNISVTTEIYSHLLEEKYIEEKQRAVQALKVL
ncbi:tyrosine-type recombinase/integrase [Staphylococcus shinii]|uniref:tyrosine-type recombinase/integrase n=1 Tax=Staphylococcus shinii TaxID=2912228 RepID=UPI00057BF09F|nr:site-specific integrase [Staphylococcus shinii]